MQHSPVQTAKRVARAGLSFRIIAEHGVFPPRDVLNAFFACGYDDAPRGRVLKWKPFSLTASEYDDLLEWWRSSHPAARVDRMRVRGANFSRWFTRAIDLPSVAAEE